MSALKEAMAFYKEKKAEDKLRKRLVRRNTDFAILEQFIQKVNENPDLRVDIHLADGTVIHMKTYHKNEARDLINGNIYEVE